METAEGTGIKITPSVVEFTDADAGVVHQMSISFRNFSKASKTIILTGTKTEKFRVNSKETQKTIAPGLELTTVVEYYNEADKDWEDSLTLLVDGKTIEVPLKAFCPKPLLSVKGSVNYGTLIADGKVLRKEIAILNHGTKKGMFKIEYNGELPITILPKQGSVKAGYSQPVRFEFTSKTIGVVNEEVRITLEGKGVKTVYVKADVVKKSLILLTAESSSKVECIKFGPTYYETDVVRSSVLYNCGPEAINFVVILEESGEGQEMGVDLTKTASAMLSPVSSYSIPNTVDLTTLVAVIPSQGKLEPYSKKTIHFKFSPRTPSTAIGWNAMERCRVPPRKDYALFVHIDTVESMSMINGESHKMAVEESRVEVALTGTALPVCVSFLPSQTINFGECPAGQSIDYPCIIRNDSTFLPVYFRAQRIAHFQPTPQKGKVEPNSNTDLTLSFRPNQIGQFRPTLMLEVIGDIFDGVNESTETARFIQKVIAKYPIDCIGDSPSIPGVQRSASIRTQRKTGTGTGQVSRLDAASSGATSTSVKVWTSKDTQNKATKSNTPMKRDCEIPVTRDKNNAHIASPNDRATSIRPSNAKETVVTEFTRKERYSYVDQDYGYTPLEESERSAHRKKYKDFTDSLRKTKAEKKRKEDYHKVNNSLDLGIKPAQGLVPPKLSSRNITEEDQTPSDAKDIDSKLLTSKQLEKNRIKSTGRRISDGLKAIPTTAQEDIDCSKELLPQELYQIIVEPKRLDFGQLCATSVATKELKITNNLNCHISFNVTIDCRELRQTSPLKQIVPPKSVAQLAFVFESSARGKFERSIHYTINDNHKSHLVVSAEIVSVALSLSTGELSLSPTPGMPAEAGMRKCLTIYNKRNMAAEFSWTPIVGKEGTSFSVRPAKGVVNPYSNLDTEVVFYPSFSAPLTGQFLLHVENGNQLQIQCNAELGATSCSFAERRVMFGSLPLNLVTTRKAHLKNTSLNHSYFKVVDPSPIPGMTITPKEGVVPVGGKTELRVSYKPEMIQKFDTQVEVDIRGWKVISLRMGGHVDPPSVALSVDTFSFGGVYCGSKATIPFTLTNVARSPANMTFDFSKYRDFQLSLPELEYDSQFTKDSEGYFYVALKGQQDVKGFLEFIPLEVAAYDFLIPVSINNTVATSPPPSPYAPSVAASRSQHAFSMEENNRKAPLAGIFSPCRRVKGTALRPPLQVSHEDLIFKLPSGYYELGVESTAGRVQGAMFVNNSNKPLEFALAIPENSPYMNDGTFRLLHETGSSLSAESGKMRGVTAPITLECGETFQLGVLFSPPKPGLYKGTISVILNDKIDQPYATINLLGELEAPLLQFEPQTVQFTPVPLRTEASTEVQIIAKGYKRATQLTWHVPEAELEDGSVLEVLQLSFPDGHKIQPCCEDRGDKEPFVLTCKLTFSCPQPVGFNTVITFIAGDNTSYELPVVAMADNCLLSCYSFLNTHQNDYHIIFEENEERRLKKHAGKGTENSVKEVEMVPCVSPIRPPTTLSTSATTTSFGLTSSSYQESSNTCTSSSYRSSPQNADNEEEDMAALSPYYYEGEDVFPESETEDGKYLREVMKIIQRWTSSQSWASGQTPLVLPYSLRSSLSLDFDDNTSRAGSWDREGKKETRTIFDIVAHFCGKPVPGIPINPTLSTDDKERTKQILWMFSTLLTFLRCQGAMLSVIKAEHLLDSQDYKRLGEVIQQSVNNTEKERNSGFNALEREREMYELLSRKAWTNIMLQVVKVLVLSKVSPSSYKKIVLPEGYDPLPPLNPDPFSSNIYSISERIILIWISHHFTEHRKSSMWTLSIEGKPPSSRWIVNFDNDFLDGLVLASLLAAHAPFLIKSHFHSLYTKPATAEQCLHNALKVVEAVRFLGMDYDILATDITEPNPVGILLFCIYLYRRLPQYLAKNEIQFSGPLHSTVTKYVRLQNPSTRPLVYHVTMAGEFASDFSIPQGSSVKVPPKGQMQLSVEYKGRFLHQCTATLILVGRRQGAPVGSTLVFNLIAEVDKIIPIGTIKCESPCYELKRLDLEVTNPFLTEGEFRIILVESKLSNHNTNSTVVKKSKKKKSLKEVESKTDHGGKKSPRRKPKVPHLLQDKITKGDTTDTLQPFLSSFWTPQKTIHLKSKETDTVEIQFLPLHVGPRQCSVLFLNTSVGEFLYSVEAEAIIPRPSYLPFSQNYVGPRITSALAAERSQGAIGLDDCIVYWQCEEGDTLIEELSLPILNANKENALVLVSQQRMSDNELKRRLQTGFISNATVLASIAALNLGGNHITTPPENILGSPNQVIEFTVECDSQFFKSVPKVCIPVAVDTESATELVRLPITFTPEGQGNYPCEIILRSPNDVRTYQVLCIVNPKGSKAELTFTCKTHESVVQEIPFVNYSDHDWTITVKIKGKGFQGPSSFIAKYNQASQYPLTFRPYYEGDVQGSVVFVNSHTLTETIFHLHGIALMPAARDHLVISCQARNVVTHNVQVKNLMGNKMIFQVFSDLEIVSGPPIIKVLPSQSVPFPVTIFPWKRGVFKGVLSFVSDEKLREALDKRMDESDSDDETENDYTKQNREIDNLQSDFLPHPDKWEDFSNPYRLWYSLEIHSSAPPPEKTIDVTCAVYNVCQIEILVTNPTNEILELDVVIEGENLDGAPKLCLESNFSVVYYVSFSPVNAGTSKGSVIFQNPIVGEFWYDLNLISKCPDPVDLPVLQCPLGRTCYQMIQLNNPSDKQVTFNVMNSNLKCFTLEQHDQKITVPPLSTVEIPVSFCPSSFGSGDHNATITFSNKQFGDIVYNLNGIGTAPAPSEDHTIKSAIGSSASIILPFHNPLDEETVADVVLTDRSKGRSGNVLIFARETCPSASPPFSLLLKQSTNISLGPRAVLDVPLSFAPNAMVLYEATCTVTLTRVNVSSTPSILSPDKNLKWVYNIKGIPEAVPVKDSKAPVLECKARERLEEKIEISFTGLDHNQVSPQLAYLRALSPLHLLGNVTPPSEYDGNPDYSTLHEDFSFEFKYSDTEVQSVMERSVGISLRKKLCHKISGSILLLFNVVFSPHKPFEHLVHLYITAAGGGIWRFPLRFRATDPPPDDVIKIESAGMNKVSSVGFRLTSLTSYAMPFKAYFTQGSARCFDVIPSEGELLPSDSSGTLFKVTYCPSSYGKTHKGKLVIQSSDMQWNYQVYGVLPDHRASNK